MWGGSNCLGSNDFAYQSAYTCEIWLQSDGRVEKKWGYRQKKKKKKKKNTV